MSKIKGKIFLRAILSLSPPYLHGILKEYHLLQNIHNKKVPIFETLALASLPQT